MVRMNSEFQQANRDCRRLTSVAGGGVESDGGAAVDGVVDHGNARHGRGRNARALDRHRSAEPTEHETQERAFKARELGKSEEGLTRWEPTPG